MNNSPVHIAIDAGATHVISLEILPHDSSDELRPDQRGRGRYLLLEAALATLTTVLERAIKQDVRRTASWNRFLVSRPKSLDSGRAEDTENQRSRRIVPLYRIAPTEPLVGTVEFDGRFEAGQRTVTLRDPVAARSTRHAGSQCVDSDPAARTGMAGPRLRGGGVALPSERLSRLTNDSGVRFRSKSAANRIVI